MHYASSKKKQKELEEFLKTPFMVGEYVSVPGVLLRCKEDKNYTCKIEEVLLGRLVVRCEGHRDTYTINKTDVAARNTRHVGADPFDKSRDRVRLVQFPLSSIIHTLDLLGERKKEKCDIIEGIEVPECNWDPYVYLPDGSKHRYQRPFVWTRAQKQALVSSIYKILHIKDVMKNIEDKASLNVQSAAWDKRIQVSTAVAVNVAIVADMALQRQYQNHEQ